MTILLSLNATKLSAQQEGEATIDGTTINYRYTPIVEDNRTGLERYISDDLNGRKVRFNIIGAPGYSANTGWRLSLAGNMYYRQAGVQNNIPGSLSLYATASLTGYCNATLFGRNHLADGRHSIDYGLNIDFEPRYIWGLDYASSSRDARGRYNSREYGAWVGYRYDISRKMYIKATLDYQNIAALKCDSRTQAITAHDVSNISSLGVRVALGIDTRQSAQLRTDGILFQIGAGTRPSFLSNLRSSLYSLDIAFDYYQPLWRGATLVFDLYGEFHNSATPWLLRAELGGDDRMRGYYLGRYNGNNLVSLQAELRQHIWEGLGVVVWGGAGEVFSKGDPLSWGKVLPTYGAGLRWSLDSRSTIRLEMAFGRNSRYFILGLSLPF